METVLSITAIALSALALLLHYTKYRNETAARLKINAEYNHLEKRVKIAIANHRSWPVSISKIEINYGYDTSYYQNLFVQNFEKQLLAGQTTYDFSITENDLQEYAERNGIKQKYYHLLWVRVFTLNKGTYSETVNIPDDSYPEIMDKNAKKYMVTDKIIGFKTTLQPIVNVLVSPDVLLRRRT